MLARQVLRPLGPAGFPLLGQSLSFARDPLAFLAGVAHRFGDISYFKLGTIPVYFVNRPDLIWEVLVLQRSKFEISTMRQRLEPVLGTGMLTSRADLHARQRKLMQPVFRKSRIDNYAEIMSEYAGRMCGRWTNGEVVNLTGELMTFTIAVVAKTLFGQDIDEDSDVVSRNLSVLMQYFSKLMSPTRGTLNLPLPSSLRFHKALRELDAVVYRMIERRQRDPGGDDLLSRLVQARDDETQAQMTEKQLRDEVFSLLMAGHETTANGLGWMIYLLAQNPEIDARLHGEIADVTKEKPRLEPSDLERLPYAKAVITESMRLYPPAWFVGRTALEDVEVGGFTIPRGATVLMSQFIAHRDGRYFKEPERFLPERWSESFAARLPRGAYFPFSAGDRHCLGEGFAWLEMLLSLARIVPRWRFELVPGQDIRPSPSITLRPNKPIKMILRARNG
ncbi:MAG TPA: cytochrome P450 [Burkholderiales bacterium]|jgi:cytochrome P450|nr:cytochrome P450 [Burkholderiales bacterium]HEX2648758.1 cytochrome P450 [Burkholderiales bacterium]